MENKQYYELISCNAGNPLVAIKPGEKEPEYTPCYNVPKWISSDSPAGIKMCDEHKERMNELVPVWNFEPYSDLRLPFYDRYSEELSNKAIESKKILIVKT